MMADDNIADDEQARGLMRSTGVSTPNLDPTERTRQDLLREIAALRAQGSLNLTALRELIEARLHGSDVAVELLRTTTDKIPALIDAAVTRLEEVHEEKFASIQTQFKERDTRTDQASKDSKVAIDAALSAQKESVEKQNTANSLATNKAELAFTKQVDEIGKRIETITKGFDDKIADLKDRLGTIESFAKGANTGVGNVGILVLGGLSVTGAAISIITLVLNLSRP